MSKIKPEDAAFTEAEYVRLLDMAASKYRFCTYGEELGEPFVIWRHDIDCSPHRALALAKIEAERHLRCIYHVLVSGRHYNVFEPEIADILRKIGSLGHEIGLHFDMDVFGTTTSTPSEDLIQRISFEKEVVETITGAPAQSISFHNYILNEGRIENTDKICGMRNACAPSIRETYRYVSDSNGIWQEENLEDILSETPTHLHVLTHPIWWTETPLKPFQRFLRAVDGHRQANLAFYLSLMQRDGRLRTIAKRLGISNADLESTHE